MSDQLYNPADQSIPFSPEAEEAVLGAILTNPTIYYNIAAFLNADDFFLLRHQWVWQAIQRIVERNEDFDYLTVGKELRDIGHLDEIGGIAYLMRLINNTPTSVHAEVYGRLVERAAIRRRLLTAAEEIKVVAMDEEMAIERVVEEAESRLFSVTEHQAQRDLIPMHDAISDYFDRIEHLIQNQDQALGLPTGFRGVDTLLGGLQRSDLLIFAGRPGMGKTSFMLSVVLNAARFGSRIAIFTMEMGVEQIVQRLISMETGINMQMLRLGQVSPQEEGRLIEAMGRLSRFQVFIDDTPALSPLQLRTKCRRMARETGIDLVIVDYMQLMNAGGMYENNRVQEISYISRSMKELARELNVPLLSAAQLSRAVEQRQDKRPQLSDLRESGCLAGDTLVYLPDTGCYLPIRELSGKADFNVTSINTRSWKLETSAVTKAFCTGVKPVYRLTTQLGRTIRATANHKFLTINGWKRLDELKVDDRIALPRVLEGPSQQTLPDAELGLLGHLIGDGCTLPKHTMQYTTREMDLAETVVKLSSQVFGDKVLPRIQKERGYNWYQVFISSTQHLTHGIKSPVRSWLESFNAFGLRSYEKKIPAQVFMQPAYSIGCFLRHLWSMDGCIRLNKAAGKQFPVVYYASSSETLAQNVQSLLLRLGINARLKHVPQKDKGRDQHHVIITGQSDLNIFVDKVGALGQYKAENLTHIVGYLETRHANTNRDVIPREVWRLFAVPAMERQGLTNRQMQSQLGNAYCGTGLYKQNVSRSRATRLAKIVKSEEIKNLANSDVYWDRIASIEADGETDVYDLTVPGNSSFVANDIIVHNSIEQDADIVMFLYRDEVYNEATEFPNQADIIVAKHRNGPTGTISLYFDKKITRFLDATAQNIDLSRS